MPKSKTSFASLWLIILALVFWEAAIAAALAHWKPWMIAVYAIAGITCLLAKVLIQNSFIRFTEPIVEYETLRLAKLEPCTFVWPGEQRLRYEDTTDTLYRGAEEPGYWFLTESGEALKVPASRVSFYVETHGNWRVEIVRHAVYLADFWEEPLKLLALHDRRDVEYHFYVSPLWTDQKEGK